MDDGKDRCRHGMRLIYVCPDCRPLSDLPALPAFIPMGYYTPTSVPVDRLDYNWEDDMTRYTVMKKEK